MNIKTWQRHLQADILSGNACMAISDPGVGKSQVAAGPIARWYRNTIQAGNPQARVGLALFFMPVQTPIGTGGMPWKGLHTFVDPRTGESTEITVTDPAMPEWQLAKCLDTGAILPAFMFDKVILIMEEWGAGSAETKRACAELLLTGAVGKWRLPEGSARIALTNFDTRDGVTKEFGHISNRVTKRKLVGDSPVWHDGFADHPYVWQGRTWSMLPESKLWGLRKPQFLFEPRPKDDAQWCTARSFTALDRYVQVLAELNGGKIPLDDPTFAEGCAGYIGMNATMDYIVTLKLRLEMATYEDIVADPMGVPVPVKADLQMLLSYELAGRCQREHLGKVLAFISKRDANGHGMTRDMSISFASTLMRRDPSLLNEPSMDEWISRNAHLMGIIGKIAA